MGWHKGDKVPVIMGKQPEPIKERKGGGGRGGREEGRGSKGGKKKYKLQRIPQVNKR